MSNFIETDIKEIDIDVSANLQSEKQNQIVPQDIDFEGKLKSDLQEHYKNELVEEIKEYNTGIAETGELQTSRKLFTNQE